jgi:endonuclease/exonuclease/phosphatase family metal-dependent hydrolase
MNLQHRWVHVLGVLVALVLVAALAVLVVRLGDARAPTDPTDPTAIPTPSGVPTGSVTPAPLPSGPGAPSITVPPLPTCATPRGATPLRVLTFNIHGGRTHTSYDIDRIAAEIEAWNPDVALLQEVHRFRRFSGFDDQPALLAARLGMQVVFGRNFTRPPEGPGRPTRESGTAILSTLPIVSSANQALPNQPGLEQRGLLHAVVQVGDQEVTIYDTHLQHTAGDIRIVQARAIRGIVLAAGGPFLVGGDLNATPDSRALEVLVKIAVDPWPAVGPDAGLTVPARGSQRRIDYVLYGGAPWLPRQAQTLLSAVSDHKAVLVDFELPAADPCGLVTP